MGFVCSLQVGLRIQSNCTSLYRSESFGRKGPPPQVLPIVRPCEFAIPAVLATSITLRHGCSCTVGSSPWRASTLDGAPCGRPQCTGHASDGRGPARPSPWSWSRRGSGSVGWRSTPCWLLSLQLQDGSSSSAAPSSAATPVGRRRWVADPMGRPRRRDVMNHAAPLAPPRAATVPVVVVATARVSPGVVMHPSSAVQGLWRAGMFVRSANAAAP